MEQPSGRTRTESSRRRLLVVEENRDLLEALEEMLEAMGFEVIAFAGEVPAIAATAVDGGVFDLLIADAVPAVGDGAGLVDRFRARLGPVPALLISGAGMSSRLRHRAAAGNVAVLPAPFTARQLEEAVLGAITGPEPSAAPVESGPVASTEHSRGVARGVRQPALRWALPLAAVLALAVGLVLRQPATGPPPLPSEPVGGSSRGPSIEVLEPRGELAGHPRRFTWTELPGAAEYVVTVLQVDDNPAWTRATARASVETPPEIVDVLQPAVRYRWMVEARDASGNLISRSARNEFRIRPDAAVISEQEEENP